MVANHTDNGNPTRYGLSDADTYKRKSGGPLDRKEWARPARQALSNPAYVVLDALTDFANAEGRCWPSHARMVLETNQCLSRLKKSINELVAGGWAEIERCGKGRTSNGYRLTGWRNDWNLNSRETPIRGARDTHERVATHPAEGRETPKEPYHGTPVKEPNQLNPNSDDDRKLDFNLDVGTRVNEGLRDYPDLYAGFTKGINAARRYFLKNPEDFERQLAELKAPESDDALPDAPGKYSKGYDAWSEGRDRQREETTPPTPTLVIAPPAPKAARCPADHPLLNNQPPGKCLKCHPRKSGKVPAVNLELTAREREAQHAQAEQAYADRQYVGAMS